MSRASKNKRSAKQRQTQVERRGRATSTAAPPSQSRIESSMQVTWPVITLSLLTLVPQAAWGDCIEAPPATVASPITITCTGPSVLPTLNVPGPTGGIATGSTVRMQSDAVLGGNGISATADADHGPLEIVNAGRIEPAGTSAIDATGQGSAGVRITNSGVVLGSTSVEGFADTTLVNASGATISGAVALDAIRVEAERAPDEALSNPTGVRSTSTVTATGGEATLENAGAIDAGSASVLVYGLEGATLTNRGSVEGDIIAGVVEGIAENDSAVARRTVMETTSSSATADGVTTVSERETTVTTESAASARADAALVNAGNATIDARTIAGARSELGDTRVENAAGASITARALVFSGALDGILTDERRESATTTVETVVGAQTRRVQTVIDASSRSQRAAEANATLENAGVITTPEVFVLAEGGGDALLENAAEIRADAGGFGQSSLVVTSRTQLVDTASSTTVVTTTPDLAAPAAQSVETDRESQSNARSVGADALLRNAASGSIDARVFLSADGDAALENAGTIVGPRVDVTTAGVTNTAATSMTHEERTFDGTNPVPTVRSTRADTFSQQQGAGGSARLENAETGRLGTDAERIGQVRVEGDAGAELVNAGEVRSSTTLEVVSRGQWNRDVRTEASSASRPTSVTITNPDAETRVERTQAANASSSVQTQAMAVEQGAATLRNDAGGLLAIDGDINVTAGTGARVASVFESGSDTVLDQTVTTRVVPGDETADPVVDVRTETVVSDQRGASRSATSTDGVFSGGAALLENEGDIDALRDVNVRGERGARLANSGAIEADDLIVSGAAGVDLTTRIESSSATPDAQVDTRRVTTTSVPTAGASTATIVDSGRTESVLSNVASAQVTARRAVSGDAVVENSGSTVLGGQLRVSAGETLAERRSSSSFEQQRAHVDEDVTSIERGLDSAFQGATEDTDATLSSSTIAASGSGVAATARVDNSGVLQVARTIDVTSTGGGDAAFTATTPGARTESQAVSVDARTRRVVEARGESQGESNRTVRNEFDERSTDNGEGNETFATHGVVETLVQTSSASSSLDIERDIGGAAQYGNEGEAHVLGALNVRGNRSAGMTAGVGSTTVVRDDIVVEAVNVTRTTTSLGASESESSDQQSLDERETLDVDGFSAESTRERVLTSRSSDASSTSASSTVERAGASVVLDGALSARSIRVQGSDGAVVRNGTAATDAAQDLRGTQLTVSASGSAAVSASDVASTSARDFSEEETIESSFPSAGMARVESHLTSEDVRAATSSRSTTVGNAAVSGDALLENGARMQFGSVSVASGGTASSDRTTDTSSSSTRRMLDRTRVDEGASSTTAETVDESSDGTTALARSLAQSGVVGNATVVNAGELLAPSVSVSSTGGGNASLQNSGRLTATSPSSIAVSANGTVTNGSSSSTARTQVVSSDVSDSEASDEDVFESTTTRTDRASSSFTTTDIGGDATLVNTVAGVIGHQVGTEVDLVNVQARDEARLQNQGLIDADATVRSVGRASSEETGSQFDAVSTQRVVGNGETSFSSTSTRVSSAASESSSVAGSATIANGASARVKGELTARSEGGASIVNEGYARRLTASSGGRPGWYGSHVFVEPHGADLGGER